MKQLIIICILSLLFACSPDDATPTAPVGNNPDLSSATLLKQGTFTGQGGHTVSGTVKIYDLSGTKYIVFDPYESQNGPDLKVYLSKTETATEYIKIGKLMSTTGKQTYQVPGMPDLSQYPYVHIWCEAYSVEFARALMQ